jgi:hypothetical protein
VKALTLHRPWTDAIARWPGLHAKRVENRTWWPRHALGEQIAIHAGKRYDEGGASFVRELAAAAHLRNGGWRCPGPGESPEGIVCVATFSGVIDGPDKRLIAGRAPDGFSWGEWWMGGIGWLLEDVVAIDPVPCRGAQGLWTVPADVEVIVRERVLAARRAA